VFSKSFRMVHSLVPRVAAFQACRNAIDDTGAIFGRTDLAAIAKGFGLRGANVTDLRQLKPLFEAYQAQDKAEIWNIHISDKVVNPSTQRGVRRGHGKM